MAAIATIDPPYVEDEGEEEESVLPPRRPMKADDEMDITPMIDMTFLLLIYFLVASRIEAQAKAELPIARYGRGVSQNTSVVITVADTGSGRGEVYLADGMIGAPLAGDEEAQAELIRVAVETGQRDGKSSVIIKAERGLPFKEVSRVANAVAAVEGVTLHVGVLEKK